MYSDKLANDYSVEDVSKVISAINEAKSSSYPFVPLNGCGRVYLVIGCGTVKKSSKLAKGMASVCRVTERPYYKGANFYIGYDNARGNIASLAEFMAVKLNEAGFMASVDYDGD